METQPAFSPEQLFDHIARDVARSICERPGDSVEQGAVRYQVAVEMVRAFQPGDVIEAMLAGHCVTLHEVIVDCGQDLSRDQEDAMRRATRSHLVALNGGFLRNLDRLALRRRGVDDARREELRVGRVVPKAGRDVVAERRHAAEVARDVTVERPVEAAIETMSTDPGPAPAMNRATRRQMARAARRTGESLVVGAKARDVPAQSAVVARVDGPAELPSPPDTPVQMPASHDFASRMAKAGGFATSTGGP